MRLVSTPTRRSLAAALVVAVGAAGCKEDAPATKPPSGAASSISAPEMPSAPDVALSDGPVKQGATARAAAYTMRVSQVKTCSTKSYTKPRAGFEKLGVRVEITATSDTRVPANSFYARIVDRTGKEYRATFGGCAPDLRHTPLSRDEQATGWMTFEIPERLSGLRLTYSPYLGDAKPQPLEFTLDR